jgi:hypothetical protein
MGSITMQKESLREKGEIPMGKKEYQNGHLFKFYILSMGQS